MGREIIIEARVDNEIVYTNYVCGRDNATTYLASIINAALEKRSEPSDDASEEEWNRYYSLIFSPTSKEMMKELQNIRSELIDYAEKDENEIQKAREELEDLRAARRNCRTFKDFCEFADDIERTRNWIENESFSRARALVDYIGQGLNSLYGHLNQHTCELWIILSE